jgi:hypothetical protein
MRSNTTVKHTSGPWNFHKQGEANSYCLLTNQKHWVIAFNQNGELWTPEQIANAKLIAAAPELLEALTGNEDSPSLYAVAWLELLLKSCNTSEVYELLVKQAADGETPDHDSVITMLRECETLVQKGKAAIEKATGSVAAPQRYTVKDNYDRLMLDGGTEEQFRDLFDTIYHYEAQDTGEDTGDTSTEEMVAGLRTDGYEVSID